MTVACSGPKTPDGAAFGVGATIDPQAKGPRFAVEKPGRWPPWETAVRRQRTLTHSVLVMMLAAVPALAQDHSEVRKELEAQYQKLVEAHNKQDLQAIVGLKTADFHAIFPDGKVGDSKVMEQYSKQFLENNEPPYDMRFTIQQLAVSENKLIAVAEVFQEVTRYRQLEGHEGQRRKVDTSVLQRETWSKTTEGWKLKCVDSVRDQKRFVDGKRVDPTKPYDPNAPPFEPDDSGAKKP